MADKEKSSDDAPEGAEAAPPKSGKRKLIIIAAAALLLIGGGGGAWFFMFRSHDKDKVAEAPKIKPPSFIDMPEMMLNLAAAPGERTQYLRIKLVLEVKDEPQVEKIKPSMPRVNDIFQTYLRELRPTDLSGSAGLFRLKEELTRRVNLAVSPGQVSAVLFKEVVIQ